MPELNNSRCPSCGAPLNTAELPDNPRCPFCGTPFQVEKPPIGLDDLAQEQTVLVNNLMQSALDLQTENSVQVSQTLKKTMPWVVGSTVVLPILIGVITLISIACIFAIVWFSLNPATFNLFK